MQTERDRPLHLLVLLYADSEDSVRNFARACELYPIVAANIGLELVYRQDASHDRDDLTEPFGFRDGISQPAVEGLAGKSSKHRDLIKTGEFVLGYKDGKGLKSTIASIDNWYDPEGYLAAHPDYPNDRRAFGLNGTYLVFRKLSQNVKADFGITSISIPAQIRNAVNCSLRGLSGDGAAARRWCWRLTTPAPNR